MYQRRSVWILGEDGVVIAVAWHVSPTQDLDEDVTIAEGRESRLHSSQPITAHKKS